MKWNIYESKNNEWFFSGNSYWIEQDSKDKNYQYFHLMNQGVEVGKVQVMLDEVSHTDAFRWDSFSGEDYNFEWEVSE